MYSGVLWQNPHQNPLNPSCFGLNFIILIKSPAHPSRVHTASQRFQKGIICGVTMTKAPSRHPKSSKTHVLDIPDIPKLHYSDQMSQVFQKGIICGVTMKKSASRHPKSSKTLCFEHSWPSWSSWWWPKILENLPKYCWGPKDSKKV